MVPFVDDPDRLLDRIKLEFQSAGACAIRTKVIVETGVVKNGQSILAAHARLVLPVKGGRLVALGNVDKLVPFAAHYPFNLFGPTIDEDDGAEMAVANQKISFGSLHITSASALPVCLTVDVKGMRTFSTLFM